MPAALSVNQVPTVTAIETQKRRQKADVHLDGAFALTLRLDVLATVRLQVGDELTTARRRQIEDQDQHAAAHAAALRLLAAAPRSEKDLRDRLRRRGLQQKAVEAAVTRMSELGYLDDTAYARSFVEARQASSPRSRRALAFELSRKGVNRDLAAETVITYSDEDAAFEAAQRRMLVLKNLDRQSFARKLGSFLASRGFSYGTSRATVDRCWSQISEEAQPGDDATDLRNP